MEMHTRQSLYEVHGITAPARVRLSSRWKGWIFAIFSKLRLALKAELQARRAAAELTRMDDRMLRDIGIGRSEIEYVVRRPEQQDHPQRANYRGTFTARIAG